MSVKARTVFTQTRYLGDEIPGLRGRCVHVVAVIRSAFPIDLGPTDDPVVITNDEALARLGGVAKYDRAEVLQVRPDGSLGFLRYHLRALDLECFAVNTK